MEEVRDVDYSLHLAPSDLDRLSQLNDLRIATLRLVLRSYTRSYTAKFSATTTRTSIESK
jgi:hypothetical protein